MGGTLVGVHLVPGQKFAPTRGVSAPVTATLDFHGHALAEVDELYPNHRPYLLVSHSLGGVLSHMQVVSLKRENWERVVGEPAREAFQKVPPGSLIYRALVFNANPRIKRVVFICAPHRGSDLAISPIAEFGMRLITLPSNIAGTIKNEVGPELAQIKGLQDRPNVCTGLSPDSPAFRTMNTVRFRRPTTQSSGIAADPDRWPRVVTALCPIGVRIGIAPNLR